MTVHQQAISKIHQLPESLANEVNDFIDFLLCRHDESRWQILSQLNEAQVLADSDIEVYARDLANYEDCLAGGEIRSSPGKT